MIADFVHVGMSVTDLGRSIAFYRDVLGMEHVETEAFSGPRYSAILGLRDVRGSLAILRGGGLELELFQFDSPMPRTRSPDEPVCEYGISHFCIRVEDIEDAYRRMSAAGVRFHCPPLSFGEAGTATYARDPDGNVIELLQKGVRRSAPGKPVN